MLIKCPACSKNIDTTLTQEDDPSWYAATCPECASTLRLNLLINVPGKDVKDKVAAFEAAKAAAIDSGMYDGVEWALNKWRATETSAKTLTSNVSDADAADAATKKGIAAEVLYYFKHSFILNANRQWLSLIRS